MTKAEIIVVVLIGLILLFIGITYFLHGRKIEKKAKIEKQKAQKVEEKKEEIKTEPEQQPVPVGIIKEEKPKNVDNQEKPDYDLAPFKDKPVENKEQTKDNKNIQEEIKNLSPEMKKVIMSDLLKPKF